MKVILLANLDTKRGLVNGAQGTILSFKCYDAKRMPHVDARHSEMTSGRILHGDDADVRQSEIQKFITERNRDCQWWPEVKFESCHEPVVIHADCMVNTLGRDNFPAKIMRTQIPLAAGYAITIHKSQVRMSTHRTEGLPANINSGHDLERGHSRHGIHFRSRPGICCA